MLSVTLGKGNVMNFKNFQIKEGVEGKILQSDFVGKDELKRSIKKEVVISFITFHKGEVNFYHHPFPRDIYEEIFIPNYPYHSRTLRNISGSIFIAFAILGYRKKSCTTSLKYKSHNQPEKDVERFMILNVRPTERCRSAWLMDSGMSFPVHFAQRNESPYHDMPVFYPFLVVAKGSQGHYPRPYNYSIAERLPNYIRD
jgi:hypothetical protein